VIRKGLGMLALASVGILLAAGWRDITRFVKIKRVSQGNGHPGLVPAAGRSAYPKGGRGRAAEGQGDFDSASRGGPAAPG
jgi:hypothetical protein